MADEDDKKDPPKEPRINPLALLGLEGQHAIKLGRGVVGRVTLAQLAFMGLLGTIVLKLSDANLLLGVAGIGFSGFCIYLIFVGRFANKNPGAALLEGAELIKWKQLVGDDRAGLIETVAASVEPSSSGTDLVPVAAQPTLDEGDDED